MINDYLRFEKELFSKGIKYIAGVDEVGRGPLAGPFVIGAVILDIGKVLDLTEGNAELRNNDVSLRNYGMIKDSKQVTEKRRRSLVEFIKNEAISYSTILFESTELDNIGVGRATSEGFFNAVKSLSVEPQHILTDSFRIKALSQDIQTNINKGDSLSITIAAASIVAKVYRDNIMEEYHKTYPEYGFDKNKGYGTAQHLKAIKEHGICPIHRHTYEPIKSMLEVS